MGKYFKDIWLGFWTVIVGMRITWKHLFAKKVTMQYPDIFHPINEEYMPKVSRNRLFVDIDDCNGCGGCERDCPVNCLKVETIKVTPGDNVAPLKSGGKRGLWVAKHEIDFSKCCFCSLCTQTCPTNAIVHTREFEYSSFTRNDLIIDFANMSPEMIQEKKDMLAKFQADKKKEEAAKKANAEASASKEVGQSA